ncbi:MAG: hypothetical protein AAF975_01840, partial [Spirochaetota bacterium]
PEVSVKVGFSQGYWGILNLNGSGMLHDVVVGLFIDLNSLYLLQSRLWGMQFRLQVHAGVLNRLIMLHAKYKLILLPATWWELGFHLYAVANIWGRIQVGPLNSEVPGSNLDEDDRDFYTLGRVRNTFILSQNEYDNRAEFNAGFALEAKFGLSAGIFQANVQALRFGMEVQGGFVLDVLTPGAFTTRFYFLVGTNLLQPQPVAEFLVESRF